MKNIYTIGMEYLSGGVIKDAARRKSRDSLVKEYDRAREKYIIEKNRLKEIKDVAEKLADEYGKGYKKMEDSYSKMSDLRTKINELDDLGERYLSPGTALSDDEEYEEYEGDEEDFEEGEDEIKDIYNLYGLKV